MEFNVYKRKLRLSLTIASQSLLCIAIAYTLMILQVWLVPDFCLSSYISGFLMQ